MLDKSCHNGLITARTARQPYSPVPKVFISYRQIDDAQRQRVREFAVRVRDQGVEVVLDQFYKDSHPGGPPDGWPKWSSDQAIHTEKVLVIGNAPWFRCFDGTENPGIGLGAACEAGNIRQRIYDLGGSQDIVRVTYFDSTDITDISFELKRYDRFDAEKHFSDIIRWIKGVAAGVPPAPITSTIPSVSWPLAVTFPQDALADRRDQCALFRDMLSGAVADSVACVIAGSGTGKSKLLKVLQDVAMTAIGRTGRVAYVKNLQEQKSICELLRYLCGALGSYMEFPRYEKTVTDDKAPTAQHLAFLRACHAL